MIEELTKIYELLKNITTEIYENIFSDVQPGRSAKEIAEKWENYMRSKGFAPAFPVNISLNEVAAHMTPGLDFDYTLQEGDVVKVDFGVQLEGYCSDVARTVVLGERKTEECKAVEEAVDAAVKQAGPGVDVQELSNAVAEVLEAYGLQPIRELGGHKIERYLLHGEIFMPNYRVEKPIYKLQPGDVLAVEVFATKGTGHVEVQGQAHIFSINEKRLSFLRAGKDVIQRLYSQYKTLPFADRWEEYLFTRRRVTLRQLVRRGFIIDYPPLVERSRAKVYQAEKTVVIGEDKILIIP
ncbi:MAG: type II methionyl aminopeptidase [bacterium]|nr:type II methionyl aminopeptidase [bacterium]